MRCSRTIRQCCAVPGVAAWKHREEFCVQDVIWTAGALKFSRGSYKNVRMRSVHAGDRDTRVARAIALNM
jgi:hypothetical protein